MIDSMNMEKQELDLLDIRQQTMDNMSFFNKLNQTSERVKMFTRLFGNKKPKYELIYEDFKRQ